MTVERIVRIIQTIDKFIQLRDACVPGSVEYKDYQQEILEWTNTYQDQLREAFRMGL